MEPQQHPHAEHQRFLATLRASVHGQTLGLRLATLAGVSAWLLVHGQNAEPRYLFVAPLLAVAGASLEVGLARRDLLLAALSRVPTAMIDLELVSEQAPWRRALVRSATAWLYAPMAAVAAAITIDALGARPGWTQQAIWMVALSLSVLATYAGLLGAWWLDRFGEQAPQPGLAALRSASASAAPTVEPAVGVVQRTPSLVPPEPTPGPFPVKGVHATSGTPVS
ncbi:MAG: hypothetical protein IPN17_06475 [Deltaproteobacteria bacterium]|nr:hypothetical protein [Deltaproteobacteria bacterium]